MQVGLSASELKENGFCAEELREGAFTAATLKPLFSTTDLRMAGFVAKEMREVHIYMQIHAHMHVAKEMREVHIYMQIHAHMHFRQGDAGGGLPFTQRSHDAHAYVHCAPCSLAVYVHAYVHVSAYVHGSAYAYVSAYVCMHMLQVGVSLAELMAGRYSPTDLRNAGYYCSEMRAVGFSIGEG